MVTRESGSGTSAECALWYWRHSAPRYYLAQDEEDAARRAVALSEAGDGAIAGVQFPDGRVVHVGEWTAYHDEQRRQDDAYRRRQATLAGAPPIPTREITEPFEHRVRITVEADEPAWLGDGLVAAREARP